MNSASTLSGSQNLLEEFTVNCSTENTILVFGEHVRQADGRTVFRFVALPCDAHLPRKNVHVQPPSAGPRYRDRELMGPGAMKTAGKTVDGICISDVPIDYSNVQGRNAVDGVPLSVSIVECLFRFRTGGH